MYFILVKSRDLEKVFSSSVYRQNVDNSVEMCIKDKILNSKTYKKNKKSIKDYMAINMDLSKTDSLFWVSFFNKIYECFT